MAREESGWKLEEELRARAKRLAKAERDMQYSRESVEELQGALLKREEELDQRRLDLGERRGWSTGKRRPGTRLPPWSFSNASSWCSTRRCWSGTSPLPCSVEDFQRHMEEAEASYAVRQLRVREDQVALQKSELASWQAALEQRELRVDADVDATRGFPAQTAALVREETLAEATEACRGLETELRDAAKRLARFEERETAWKTLKGKHEKRIRELEKELDMVKAVPAPAASKTAGRRGKGAVDRDARIAELEKLLDDSKVAWVALAQQPEETGSVPQGFTDMVRALYSRVNRGLPVRPWDGRGAGGGCGRAHPVGDGAGGAAAVGRCAD